MQRKSRILIDQSHSQAWTIDLALAQQMNPANPADASYAKLRELAEDAGYEVLAHTTGEISSALLSDVDVLVLPHAATSDWEHTVGYGSPVLAKNEIDAISQFVVSGGGLLVLGENEQAKYGNNFNELISRYGMKLSNETVQDPAKNFKDVASWPKPEFPTLLLSDFRFMVHEVVLYRTGTLELASDFAGEVFLRTSESALPAQAPVAAAVRNGKGQVVVIADSDIFGDDSINDLDNSKLLLNVLGFLALGSKQASRDIEAARTKLENNAAWKSMRAAVEELRPLQNKDGAIEDPTFHPKASALLDQLLAGIRDLAPSFSHQADYLTQAVKDLEGWRAGGFGKPDFYESLQLFRPDLMRKNDIQHLAVFSMYTQNGNPNRNLEVLVTNTFWPQWLADKEKKYSNPAFIPIEFVGFTAGYDTNSAVFFPETVAVREVATYHWGGIFCDREAARFRKVVAGAKELLYLPLPASAEELLSDQLLAQETFVLWDLIHDRTHSRGDLPFDPFMIKQRMPFWMYALEELRCDLSTFRETLVLEAEGDRLAKYIRYAILFDRLFRFPITGSRVRNYDGLGGQIMFAHLHKSGALHWRDNRLTFEWDKVIDSVVELSNQVDALYHDGINRSRLAQWIAAYEFVKGLVPPHPASNWAKGPEQLPTGGELKEVVNLVLDDEFPLNVFYETLNRKLSDLVLATKGITA
ncbi:MAG: hypothetical protein F2536_05595 [Actinobacteria bacterium]|uniref:Unannotated protein n=1 Tax=freshwater metagenome TaxID=449393 RepID=A0A6J6CJY4_9ZZZZ|nr:hypothetical protein [Actinomycetota bacterium]MTA90366.1 hypothetical protein [Actinomycetota bacterium]